VILSIELIASFSDCPLGRFPSFSTVYEITAGIPYSLAALAIPIAYSI